MDEETTRKVMMKYFDLKGMKPIAQRGAGPDILIDGTAIETKGSPLNRFEVKRMLTQITEYAYEYKRTGLALPIDGLNIEIAHQLDTLHAQLQYAGREPFFLYVLFDVSDKTFYICELNLPTGGIVVSHFLDGSVKRFLSQSDTIATALENLEPLFNYDTAKWARERFQEEIIRLGLNDFRGRRTTKIEI